MAFLHAVNPGGFKYPNAETLGFEHGAYSCHYRHRIPSSLATWTLRERLPASPGVRVLGACGRNLSKKPLVLYRALSKDPIIWGFRNTKDPIIWGFINTGF